jgi:hypothetical protein
VRPLLGVLCATAITGHFALIALQVSPWRAWGGRTAEYYRALSFANRNFRFFAPNVAPDRVLHIELTQRSGARRAYALPGMGREFELRMQAMLNRFDEDPTASARYARAWADYALARNPDAVAVMIEVGYHRLPTLRTAAGGGAASLLPFYRQSFAR